jgi:hypothetical protein
MQSIPAKHFCTNLQLLMPTCCCLLLPVVCKHVEHKANESTPCGMVMQLQHVAELTDC